MINYFSMPKDPQVVINKAEAWISKVNNCDTDFIVNSQINIIKSKLKSINNRQDAINYVKTVYLNNVGTTDSDLIEDTFYKYSNSFYQGHSISEQHKTFLYGNKHRGSNFLFDMIAACETCIFPDLRFKSDIIAFDLAFALSVLSFQDIYDTYLVALLDYIPSEKSYDFTILDAQIASAASNGLDGVHTASFDVDKDAAQDILLKYRSTFEYLQTCISNSIKKALTPPKALPPSNSDWSLEDDYYDAQFELLEELSFEGHSLNIVGNATDNDNTEVKVNDLEQSKEITVNTSNTITLEVNSMTNSNSSTSSNKTPNRAARRQAARDAKNAATSNNVVTPEVQTNLNNQSDTVITVDSSINTNINTTTEVNTMTNSNTVSVASILASAAFPLKANFVPFANDTADVIAAGTAKVAAHNADMTAKKAAFVSKFSFLGTIVKETRPIRKVDVHLLKRGAGKVASEFIDFGVVSNKLADRVIGPTTSADLANHVSNFLVKIAAKLSATQKAEILGEIFGSVKNNSDTVVSIHEVISIDFRANTLTVNNDVRKVNRYTAFGTTIVPGADCLFAFAMQLAGGSAKQAVISVANASAFFAPVVNYGHIPTEDEIAYHVNANIIYTASVSSTNTFPGVHYTNGKQSPELLAAVLKRGFVATCDKTNIKFVTIDDGALALGVGINAETGAFQTANDAGKPTKFFNRAAANNYSCADMVDRVASNFGFALTGGKVAKTKGALKKVAFTNSVLGFGSGVAILNPNSGFEYMIKKSFAASVNISLFSELADASNGVTTLAGNAYDAIEAIVGKTFKAGQVMLSLNDVDVIRNEEVISSVVVISGSATVDPLDANAVKIILNTEIRETRQWVKTRRFGTKFTTHPYAAQFSGVGSESEAWDIILNNETVKGQGALLEMFANASDADWALDNGKGVMTSSNGEVVNLMVEDNGFNSWKLSSVKKDVVLSMEIAKSVWTNMAVLAGQANVTVVAETETSVIVNEVVDVIFGSLVFDVEIASALESVSSSNLTLESVAAVSLQSAKLGESLYSEINSKVVKYEGLANAFATGVSDVVIDVCDVDAINAFCKVIANAKTQRAIIDSLAKTYAGNVSFVNGKTSALVNFEIVSAFGQFSILNGGAVAEAAKVVELVLCIADGRANYAVFQAASNANKKIIKTAVDSDNVLKRAARAGKLAYGKVRTSYHPIVNSVDEIPTIVVNAKCPIIRKAALVNGGFVGFARTPMPFLGAARLVMTNDATICDVAQVLVDPYVWASLNEGK